MKHVFETRYLGTAAPFGICGRWFHALVALAFGVGLVGAETLEVKVVEIEGRLIEPTITPALAGDRDAFDAIIGKLAPLGPNRGVHWLMDRKVEARADGEKVRSDQIEQHKLPDRRGEQLPTGHRLEWNAKENQRRIDVLPLPNNERAPVYHFDLVHAPDGRWSLSAAARGVRGVVMVFERIEGRPVNTTGREWLAASFFTERPRTFNPDPAWRMVADAEGPCGGMVRIQSQVEGGKAGMVSTNFKSYHEVMQEFDDESALFRTQPGMGPDEGFRVVICQYDLPVERRPGKVIRWDGLAAARFDPQKMTADATKKVTNVFTDTRTDEGFKISGITERQPDCYLRAVIFKTP